MCAHRTIQIWKRIIGLSTGTKNVGRFGWIFLSWKWIISARFHAMMICTFNVDVWMAADEKPQSMNSFSNMSVAPLISKTLCKRFGFIYIPLRTCCRCWSTLQTQSHTVLQRHQRTISKVRIFQLYTHRIFGMHETTHPMCRKLAIRNLKSENPQWQSAQRLFASKARKWDETAAISS